MDCSPPASYVCGISEAWILKCVAIPFSRGYSWPRDQTCISCISGAGLHAHGLLILLKITLIIKVNLKFMFKYKLKLLLLISSNFKSSAMTSNAIQQVLQCYHTAEGESFSVTGY